ncbi:hypothetical protein OGAPHI_004789 [Ogataea philodendri]|uniref:Ribosomal RNA-processing protein 43 n=1 Tax=Ogataea philodendri TaxID=1378263 RepID=A0A9P8P2V1_9ASCO|nr:uncharacterized protein OGAPHI_004789 [Ogataea philodendri]KAH3664075.1 hypothetical protein OGAPHI_004789 [Ogataea philodendri]
MSETATIKPNKFPPEVLARIAPDVLLQKYLQVGVRPSLRKFDEFRPVQISRAGVGRYESDGNGDINKVGSILGSSIVKSGSTTVICLISGGIVEDSLELVNDYRTKLEKDIIDGETYTESKNTSVYTEVEISRGRSGPPNEEEICLSQQLYDTVYHSGLIDREALKIKLGYKGDQPLDSDFMPQNSYSFVLYATIQVFSRTGPVYDLCYGALVSALRGTRLPAVYIDEKRTEVGVRRVRTEEYDLICETEKSSPLQLNQDKLGWGSTFGLVQLDKDIPRDQDKMEIDTDDRILLADLEGEAEEEIGTRLEVGSNGKSLNRLTIYNVGKISKQDLQQAIALDLLLGRSEVPLSRNSQWGTCVGVVVGLESFSVQVNVFVDLGSNTTSNSLDNLGLLGALLVDLDVESNEQNQVGRDNCTSAESCQWCSCAVSTVGQGRIEVVDDFLVGGEINKREIKDELQNLESGDPFFPPDADSSGCQEVVPVHDHVNKQVQGDGNPRDGGQTDKLCVAQQSGGTVVVSVEEGEFFLFHHQEQRVDELGELCKVVQVVEYDHLLGPCTVITDGVVEAVGVDHRDELLGHQNNKSQRQRGQEQVVDLEQSVQNKRFPLVGLDHGGSTQNHNVVHGNRAKHRDRSGEKGLARLEVELAWNKPATGQLGDKHVKVSKQVHAEWTLKTGHGKRSE